MNTRVSNSDSVNPKLPDWGGNWAEFEDYELKCKLEADGTREAEVELLGPKLARSLHGKGWEVASRAV